MNLVQHPAWMPEVVIRRVAALVVLVAIAGLATGSTWILWFLALDFGIRGFAGPTASPLAMVARRLSLPGGPTQRRVAGAPKRFAARLGFAMFAGAAVLATFLDLVEVAWALAAAVMVLATLEAVAGFCLGCHLYRVLVRLGWAGRDGCPTCADGS
jgi:hypothetical protein